jgi:tight adherence protein B
MGAVLGLLFGVGLLLVWSAFQNPPARQTARAPRLRPLLSSAGLGEVSTVGFVIVCVVSAVVATAVVLVA